MRPLLVSKCHIEIPDFFKQDIMVIIVVHFSGQLCYILLDHHTLNSVMIHWNEKIFSCLKRLLHLHSIPPKLSWWLLDWSQLNFKHTNSLNTTLYTTDTFSLSARYWCQSKKGGPWTWYWYQGLNWLTNIDERVFCFSEEINISRRQSMQWRLDYTCVCEDNVR